MSTAYSGVDGKVSLAGTDMDVTGHSFEVSDDGFDSTTTADAGWQDMKDSIRKVSGSFDCFFNTSKNPFTIGSLFQRPSVYPLVKLIVSSTGSFAQGNAKINKISFKSGTKEGITFTCSFESVGVWTMP